MEASRKGKEFIMPSWIIPFIAFHKLCVTMYCGSLMFTKSIMLLRCSRSPKKQAVRFLQWSTSVFAKGGKFWVVISRRVLPHATQEPPWFMAKPIVRNLMWGWRNPSRAVSADAAVTGVSLFAQFSSCTQQGKFTRQCLSFFFFSAPSSGKAQHIVQLLWDKEVRETVMGSLCSNILLHFLLSHHLSANQCGMVQRMKPVQVLAQHSAIFSALSLTWRQLLTVCWKYQAN